MAKPKQAEYQKQQHHKRNSQSKAHKIHTSLSNEILGTRREWWHKVTKKSIKLKWKPHKKCSILLDYRSDLNKWYKG